MDLNDVPDGKENGGAESVPLAEPGPNTQVVWPSLSVPFIFAVSAIGSAWGIKRETTSAPVPVRCEHTLAVDVQTPTSSSAKCTEGSKQPDDPPKHGDARSSAAEKGSRC